MGATLPIHTYSLVPQTIGRADLVVTHVMKPVASLSEEATYDRDAAPLREGHRRWLSRVVQHLLAERARSGGLAAERGCLVSRVTDFADQLAVLRLVFIRLRVFSLCQSLHCSRLQFHGRIGRVQNRRTARVVAPAKFV